MRGTTHLEGVLDTYYTASKAAGIPDLFNIAFKEYVERLIQVAQPHNRSLRQSCNCGRRSANFHSILGGESDEEDNSDDEEDPQAALEVHKSDWDQKSSGRKEHKRDDRFYKKLGAPSKQQAMIPRTKWNTFSREDQIAWTKLSESSKKVILGIPDNEKGSNSNPVAIVNNHEMIFEDEEEDGTGNDSPSISAQTHSSSKRSIVASVHQSSPTRRTIQANTSMLCDTSEAKYQEPEERGLLCMATHKATKSNKQIDVNSAFSEAIEKKSPSHVSWDNGIEQPTTKRHKKPQLQVNVASRKKVTLQENGTLTGLGSLDEEEQTNPNQTNPSTQVSTPCVDANTQPRTHVANCRTGTQPGTAIGGGCGCGRGCGRTPRSHCFGAGGQSYGTVAPNGCTHLIPRSVCNSPPQPSATEQYIHGVTVTRYGDGSHQDGEHQSYPITSTSQNRLGRQMAVSNRTTLYIACRGRNLTVAGDILCDCNSPYHMGVREDGTFIGLKDDKDAMGNPLAIVPCGVQPDPIISQQTIVLHAKEDSTDRLQEGTSGAIV